MNTSVTSLPPSSPRAGFSLVEVIVATVVLSVGILGLGATTAYMVRQTTLGGITTQRTVAVQSVVERVRAMDYDSVGSGSASVGSFDVAWSSQESDRSKLVRVVSVGPGLTSVDGIPTLAAAVADTFEYRVIRP